jgi:hypothetical protein
VVGTDTYCTVIAGLWIRIRMGSGFGWDPDSVTLWIRIRIGNPDPGARKLRNFRGKNALFSYRYLKKNLPLKRYNYRYFLKKKFDEKHEYFLFELTQISISNKI